MILELDLGNSQGENVKQDKGFTLIEALVSLVILSLILIGLLSASLIAYRISFNNKVRNEAVRLAKEKINSFKGTLDTSMLKHETCSEADNSDKVIRSFGNFNYPFYVVGKINDSGYFYELRITICDKDKKDIYTTKTVVGKSINE